MLNHDVERKGSYDVFAFINIIQVIMEKVFNLDKQSIIIYGAAAIGLIVYDICKELNLPVAGFIDKRGDEIHEIQGVKVYNIDSAEIDAIDRQCIIFIAVKNVFEHDNIARKLIEKGFVNIIYRPSTVIKGAGNKDEKRLNEVYDKFMQKEFICDDIPKSFSVHEYEYRDYATIKKLGNGQERVAYIPVEYLFTDKKKAGKWSWVDIPVMSLIPHVAFFKWMDNQPGFSYDMYLDFCIDSTKIKGQIKVTDRWKENVIKNRADVYANMNQSLERDFDFFIRNAPNAKWNTNGYFNLVSGKHRAAFWLAKGRHYIPLRISNTDFQMWINEFKVDKIIHCLRERGIVSVNAPIEHPYFYDIQCQNRDFYFHLLCDFVFEVALDQYKEKRYIKLEELSPVFVSLNDDGYISRTLQRYAIPVEVHNKSKVSVILEDLIVENFEVSTSQKYSWALIEFNYGDDKLDFIHILTRNISHIICLVSPEYIDEFEQDINIQFAIVKRREALKDGSRVFVYMIERNK